MPIDFKQLMHLATIPGKLRYFLTVALGYLAAATVMSLAAGWDMLRLEANIENVAHERGAALFRQFELMRLWSRQANPAHPQTAADAMTRQIAELSELVDNTEGIRFRLVAPPAADDAQPTADAWESATFALFARQPGLGERLELVASPGAAPVHRYMAPLAQSDQALSIVMPARRLIAIRNERMTTALFLSFGGFLLIGGLAHLAARRTYRNYLKLAQLSRHQQLLIEERTADLSMANTLLAAEVEERTLNQARLELSESRHRSVIESTQDGIALVEGDVIGLVNSRLAEMLAMPAERFIGRPWTDLLDAADRPAAQAYRDRRLAGADAPICLRARLRRDEAAGDAPTVDMQVLPVDGTAGRTPPTGSLAHPSGHWVWNLRNVSDRLTAERDRRMVAAVFESTAEAIMVTDLDNRIVMINPAFSRITGYSAPEVVGKTPAVLSSGRHDAGFYRDMWQILDRQGVWAGEIWNRRKDGSLYVEWLTVTALRPRGADGRTVEAESGYVGVFTDITLRKEAEERLRHKASHDALTGLPNRSLFEDRLQLAISQARRYRRSFALLYIDLDHFKEVNDTLGHAAGDELLTEAARRMSECIRESDTLSRFGGDEFAVLLSEVDALAEIEEIAGRIVAGLDQPFSLKLGPARISGSVGIAIFPQHGADAAALKHNADLALYRVKETSRNAYRLFSAELGEDAAPH